VSVRSQASSFLPAVSFYLAQLWLVGPRVCRHSKLARLAFTLILCFNLIRLSTSSLVGARVLSNNIRGLCSDYEAWLKNCLRLCRGVWR